MLQGALHLDGWTAAHVGCQPTLVLGWAVPCGTAPNSLPWWTPLGLVDACSWCCSRVCSGRSSAHGACWAAARPGAGGLLPALAGHGPAWALDVPRTPAHGSCCLAGCSRACTIECQCWLPVALASARGGPGLAAAPARVVERGAAGPHVAASGWVAERQLWLAGEVMTSAALTSAALFNLENS